MLFRLQNIDSPGLIWKIFRNKDLGDPFPFGSAQGQDFGSGLTPSTTLRVTPAERLNLAAGEIFLWASGSGRASRLLACQLSRMADWVSVMAVTLVCDVKRLPSGTNLGGCFPGDDDIRSRAVDDCLQFGLLLGGNRELVQCLLKVVQKRLPLRGANLQMGMRVRHRLTCVFLRAACSPANHLRDQVLEARRRHAMVRFVYQGIGIQSRVYHDSVNEVVHHGSDAIHATKSVVERGLFQWLHMNLRLAQQCTRAAFEETRSGETRGHPGRFPDLWQLVV